VPLVNRPWTTSIPKVGGSNPPGGASNHTDLRHFGYGHRGQIAQGGAVGLDLGPQVGQHLCGLGLETALGEAAGNRPVDGAAIHDADLTADEQQIAGADDRGISLGDPVRSRSAHCLQLRLLGPRLAGRQVRTWRTA